MPHIHEKIDYCGDAYIVNGDAVLLRFHEKYSMWCPAGGHIELDEDPEEGALREAKEETGLDVTLVGDRLSELTDGEREVLPPRFINRHRINPTHEHVCFTYFATSTSREVVPGPGEKDVEMRWFTKADLDDPKNGVQERVKRYAKAALDALGTG